MRDCARGFDRVNVFEARPKEGCAIDISLLTDERSHVNDNPQMRVDSTARVDLEEAGLGCSDISGSPTSPMIDPICPRDPGR